MRGNHPKFVAAAVQASSVFHDLEAPVDKTIALMEEAAAKGAALIAFPELWIPGYPFWAWLGSPAWGMQFVQTYADNSMVVGEREFARIAEAANRMGLHVLLAFSERAGGSLYMAQSLIDATGRVVAHRRKLRPTHVERTVFGDGDGSGLRVDVTALGRIGALCCWEHLQPLSKYALYSMNEQVHVASWPAFSLYEGKAYALSAAANMAATQVYALEGQCFVVAATSVVTPDVVDQLCDTPDKVELLPLGGGAAAIFGPDGRPLGNRLAPTEEGLVIAEIDLGLIPLAKAAADPAGHYARPDVTRLLLNTMPAPPVQHVARPLHPILATGEDRSLDENA